MSPQIHRQTAGLAPLTRPGLDATAGLTPMQDLRVIGPLRAARHRMRERGQDVHELDAAIPLVAAGLIEVLRELADGLTSSYPDFDPTTGRMSL